MYEKQTWVTGDVVTADRLNHMEDGITSAQAYTESEDVKFSGSVTTAKNNGLYIAQIDCNLSDAPEQIKVTFDGTEYTCEKVVSSLSFGYGGLNASLDNDFSEYPFGVIVSSRGVFISTETASTHQVEITAITKSVNQDFADLIPVMQLISGVTNSADALTAFSAGKLLYYKYGTDFHIVTGIDNTNNVFITTPSDGAASCNFSGTKIDISLK